MTSCRRFVGTLLSEAVFRRLLSYCSQHKITKSEALRSSIELQVVDVGEVTSSDLESLVLEPQRSKAVTILVNEREKQALKKRMRDDGFTRLSAWCRSVLLNVSTRKPSITDKELDLLKEGRTQIRRVGINLNQIAHRLQKDEHVDGDEIFTLLSDAQSDVKAYQDLVLDFIESCRSRW